MASEDLRIFLAKPGDSPEVLQLLTLQFAEHEIDVPGEQLRDAVEAVLSDERLGFFLLARATDQNVGLACISFCWTLEHGGKSAWLDELYVLSEFRSRGIGSRLIEVVLQKTSDMGCAAVDLEVDVEHLEAERLYQRAGFETLPRSRWVKELR